jgi:hypothetical protein
MSKPAHLNLTSRRRFVAAGSGGALILGMGLKVFADRDDAKQHNLDREATTHTLVQFTAVLFGRALSVADAADLSDRIRYLLSSDATLKADCEALAKWLHEQGLRSSGEGFGGCSSVQQASIVNSLMRINWRTLSARLLSRVSDRERVHYRMRGSAVPQLAWIYRHSAAAWRARGYARWPGTQGNWREVLVAGVPYPA